MSEPETTARAVLIHVGQDKENPHEPRWVPKMVSTHPIGDMQFDVLTVVCDVKGCNATRTSVGWASKQLFHGGM